MDFRSKRTCSNACNYCGNAHAITIWTCTLRRFTFCCFSVVVQTDIGEADVFDSLSIYVQYNNLDDSCVVRMWSKLLLAITIKIDFGKYPLKLHNSSRCWQIHENALPATRVKHRAIGYTIASLHSIRFENYVNRQRLYVPVAANAFASLDFIIQHQQSLISNKWLSHCGEIDVFNYLNYLDASLAWLWSQLCVFPSHFIHLDSVGFQFDAFDHHLLHEWFHHPHQTPPSFTWIRFANILSIGQLWI